MDKFSLEHCPDVLGIADLQSLLGIGRSKAYRLIRENKIKHIRIGKSIRIPKAYVLEFFEIMAAECYAEGGYNEAEATPGKETG